MDMESIAAPAATCSEAACSDALDRASGLLESANSVLHILSSYLDERKDEVGKAPSTCVLGVVRLIEFALTAIEGAWSELPAAQAKREAFHG